MITPLKDLFLANPFKQPWVEALGGVWAALEAVSAEGDAAPKPMPLTGRARRNQDGSKREKEYGRRSRKAMDVIKDLPVVFDYEDGSQLPVVYTVNKPPVATPPAAPLTEVQKQEKVRKRLAAWRAKVQAKKKKAAPGEAQSSTDEAPPSEAVLAEEVKAESEASETVKVEEAEAPKPKYWFQYGAELVGEESASSSQGRPAQADSSFHSWMSSQYETVQTDFWDMVKQGLLKESPETQQQFLQEKLREACQANMVEEIVPRSVARITAKFMKMDMDFILGVLRSREKLTYKLDEAIIEMATTEEESPEELAKADEGEADFSVEVQDPSEIKDPQ